MVPERLKWPFSYRLCPPYTIRPAAWPAGSIHLGALLRGFLDRKSDVDPGTHTLWLGLQRLHDVTAMWGIRAHPAHSPLVFSPRYG
jgi:hypothetical protein